MAVYKVLGDRTLKKITIKESKILRGKAFYLAITGIVNNNFCIYWKDEFYNVVAVEVDNDNLEGHTIEI